MMTIHARLESGQLNEAAELAELLRCASGDGAIVSFLGIARSETKHLERVEKLVLLHHESLTLKSLEQIAFDAAQRFAVSQVHVVHRCGEIQPGQPIVFAGASAPHRRAAFEAADYLMDRLKTEAVFWKREEGPSGASWIEPTEADYADRGRWE